MRRVVPVETVEAMLLTPPVHRRAALAKGRAGGAVSRAGAGGSGEGLDGITREDTEKAMMTLGADSRV